jgi:hypothetical protein
LAFLEFFIGVILLIKGEITGDALSWLAIVATGRDDSDQEVRFTQVNPRPDRVQIGELKGTEA